MTLDLLKIDITTGHGRSLQSPMLRAIGLRKGEGRHRPHVLDATAGFGEDAWIIASHGCRVTMVERHPQVAVLLRDALHRAAVVRPDIVERLSLIEADARAVLADLPRYFPDDSPTALHLDPMFPTGRKAMERKPFRVLRLLVGHDADSRELLQLALQHFRGQGRIAVKRPLKAARLIDLPEPVHSHKGAAVRYDVYVV